MLISCHYCVGVAAIVWQTAMGEAAIVLVAAIESQRPVVPRPAGEWGGTTGRWDPGTELNQIFQNPSHFFKI